MENIETKKTFNNKQLVSIVTAFVLAAIAGTGILYEFRQVQAELNEVKADTERVDDRHDRKHERVMEAIKELQKSGSDKKK